MTEVSGAEPGRAEKQPAEVSREEPSYLESVVLMLHWFLPCVSKVVSGRDCLALSFLSGF